MTAAAPTSLTPPEAATNVPGLPDDRTPCPGRHRRTLVSGAIVLFATALVCTSALEATLWWESRGPLSLLAVFTRPLDALVVLLVALLWWSLTGRLWVSVGLTVFFVGLLAGVSSVKMSYLNEPLYPSDYQYLRSLSFLRGMVEPTALVLGLVLVGVLVGATTIATVTIGRRRTPVTRSDHPRAWLTIVVARVLGVVVITTLLASTVNFNDAGSRWRRFFEAGGSIWQPSSQAKNYRENGFVAGLLYNMPITPMEVPEGYSRATMEDLARRYAAEASAANTGRAPGALDDVNVVLVLGEAFADLGRLDGVQVSRDTMPLTRQTMADSWSGSALANLYGTGTSSMEFSALTGQTIGLFNPQITAPYQHFMTNLESYPSAVGWFAANGHRPVAVHPYEREFYRRDVIYPMLGFRDFIDDRSMTSDEHIERNEFISDRAAFEQVDELIDSTEEPLFVNLVTMQNHVPTVDLYDDPVPVETMGEDSAESALGGYARGQELTDGFLHEWLERLSDETEPTVVVFYGDHYPAILSPDVYGRNPGLGHLQTPMFIWTNQGTTPRSLPVTAPANFLPLVFDLVDAPRSPYYQLLSDVAEQIGAVGYGRIVAPDGTELSEADLTPDQARLLHDYRLVQYDFSIGQRYVVDEMWFEFG